LIIDDEPVVMDVMRGVLGNEGHTLEFAADAASGRELLERATDWDAVLLDVMLPDSDGLTVLRWLREHRPEIAVVMITAYGTVQNAVEAMRAGAFHYLTKPFNNDEVRLLVRQAVQTTRLRMENRNLKQALEQQTKFEQIVGKSRPMQEVYRFIEQVAPSRSTVLIQGESGTGKELVAEAIHRRSPRAAKPFIIVNSSSIPTELLEDNLFGHSRGAFTGATGDKIGLVEAADGGTIVFDEITSVAPAVQTKLLRVIQEKEYLPLGAVKSRTVDVRIIAATNESVRDLVEAGTFRDDLYYRLNVISLTLPPLRTRLGDLPLLVAHFLERYNVENGKQVKMLEPEVLHRLVSYRWPGNVRELENAIERGVVLAPGDEFTMDLLPAEVHEKLELPSAVHLDDVDFYGAISAYERQLIETALNRAGGVQKQAAAMLGLKPTTLNEKMKRLGIRG
jgi:two-component system response regulator PilR (NtrC family)